LKLTTKNLISKFLTINLRLIVNLPSPEHKQDV